MALTGVGTRVCLHQGSEEVKRNRPQRAQRYNWPCLVAQGTRQRRLAAAAAAAARTHPRSGGGSGPHSPKGRLRHRKGCCQAIHMAQKKRHLAFKKHNANKKSTDTIPRSARTITPRPNGRGKANSSTPIVLDHHPRGLLLPSVAKPCRAKTTRQERTTAAKGPSHNQAERQK